MRGANDEEGRVKMVSPEEQADLLLSLKHEDTSRRKTKTVLVTISTLNAFTISNIIIIINIINIIIAMHSPSAALSTSSSVQYIIIIVSEMQTAENLLCFQYHAQMQKYVLCKLFQVKITMYTSFIDS